MEGIHRIIRGENIERKKRDITERTREKVREKKKGERADEIARKGESKIDVFSKK